MAPHSGHEDAGDLPASGGAFYAVHASRSFYVSLTKFMSSGPSWLGAGEGKRIADLRKLMGATTGQRRRGHHPQEMGQRHRTQRDSRLDADETARFELSFSRGIRIGAVKQFSVSVAVPSEVNLRTWFFRELRTGN